MFGSDRKQNRLALLPANWLSLAHAFLHQARTRPHALAIVDSLGTKLTYQRLLTASVALANELSKELNSSNCVGILLPPSAGAVIANLAVALLGKVSVNLNYSNGQRPLALSLEDCKIEHIVSSKRFLKRVELEIDSKKLVDLEEVKEGVGLLKRIEAWTEAELLPEVLLQHLLPGLSPYRRIKLTDRLAELSRNHSFPVSRLEDPATIIFTSGSTAAPKGVVLSHSNILSNIQAIKMQGHINDGEVVLGVIPFFHSFGLTMTLWAPLCLGETVVYHYNPLDARRIGELCESYKATTLVCTPTMMSSYLKRCSTEEFRSLKNCILGGEKVKRQQRLDFVEKLGIEPLEGYGLAETSPVVSCNVGVPVTLTDGRTVCGTKPGTVGHPIPGTQIRIVDETTGREMPAGNDGLILVKGPQVMLGYLNRPVDTSRVLKDGWFTTGDIGYLDRDGFLTITGRRSQFSKIGGEMVSHLAVEDEIMQVTGITEQTLCVTNAADENRGERLMVVYSDLGMTPKMVIEKLRASKVARLWIPNEDDFVKLSEMPVMTNGKVDLKRIKELASMHLAIRNRSSSGMTEVQSYGRYTKLGDKS